MSAWPRFRQGAAIVTTVCATIVGLVAWEFQAAAAEYLLHPGDVLEISALGLSELRQTSSINPDGQASLPLVGSIKAAGLSLAKLREKIGELLPTKVFRRRTMDGREYPVVVALDEILITVAEYRPVYLDGDVAKPGAQTYRPGMTVRQALALAGGYDVMRFHGRDPFLETADFRAEYYSLWADFAKEQAHIARLQAELGNKPAIDRQGWVDTPISHSVAAEIERLENEQFEARKADLQHEKDHLRRAIVQEDGRIGVLNEQETKEKEGAQADEADLQQMRESFKKGIIPTTRMSEARRLTLFSATQALQTTAVLAQAERERENLRRGLEKLDDDRRMQLLGDLQGAEVNLEGIRARLQAVGDKLMYSGMVRSQLVRGIGSQPDVKISRDVDGDRQTLVADQETELMPGDVIEVAVRLEEMAASAP
jgi:polysaccharide export outer membrane protein